MYKNSYKNDKFRVQVHYNTKFLSICIPMHMNLNFVIFM
jgi:hypothetical protein